jgi:hypothetical protein
MLPGLGYNLIPGSAVLRPQDVFATSIYTGNGSSQTITTGVDLATHGGMVWGKSRSNVSNHELADTIRGFPSQRLSSNTTNAASAGGDVTGVTSTGVSLTNSGGNMNFSGYTQAMWSFRRAPNFFDVVTWTGDGTNPRTISHSLGVAPGMLMVKSTNNANDWLMYHRSLGATKNLRLNQANAEQVASAFWNDTAPTSSQFTVTGSMNNAGWTYVAYIFAHDAGADGIVQCGSYTGNGSTSGPTVTLGWLPQLLLVKRTDTAGPWWMFDTSRGLGAGVDAILSPNTSAAEDNTADRFGMVAGGFQPTTTNNTVNASGGNYVYMAIRAPIV